MVVSVDERPVPACPVCRSDDIARDSASPWIFLGALLLFPLTLLLFLLNKNLACRSCGVRFKDTR